MSKRTLQDEIEILEMCLPLYCDAGGIWFRNNHNMADGNFKDWGAARAFTRAATALPALVKALEDVIRDINDYERVNNLAPNPGRTECWDSVARAKAVLGVVGKETTQ